MLTNSKSKETATREITEELGVGLGLGLHFGNIINRWPSSVLYLFTDLLNATN
jgi:hypothetical protein